ncbi:hypothetical protein DL96DRAFT_1578456 [Flagelloscypha sp. PMI_526]|nr:hypothetical protein DL96DRAFT_1578456 [Flagelloscypha sp. PMI_526]
MDLSSSLIGTDILPAQLCNLSANDVALLDAVIARAGPAATTFLSIFKPYSEVLTEHGLDPQETYYYDKLLKLGLIKESTWQQRWLRVKSRQKPLTSQPKKHIPSRPSPPVYSHAEETDDLFSEATTSRVPQYHATSKFDDTSIDDSELLPSAPIVQHTPLFPPAHRTQRRIGRYAASDQTDDDVLRTKPPSYQSNDRGTETASSSPSLHVKKLPVSRPTRLFLAPPDPSRIPPSNQERRGSILNEEDAWNKVKIVRDEQIAVQFYEDRLTERCWDVWKQGALWIQRTVMQVAAARDNLLLRAAFQKWRENTLERLALYERVAHIHNRRLLRQAFARWKQTKKTRYQALIRQNYRIFKANRDNRIIVSAWQSWRRVNQLWQADRHYTIQLAASALHQWLKRAQKVRTMKIQADQFYTSGSGERALRVWDHWQKMTSLRHRFQQIRYQVDSRILQNALLVWRNRSHNYRVADASADDLARKHAFRRWQGALQRLESLDERLQEHLAAQDRNRLVAVVRVWKAKEGGRLLERVKKRRLLKLAFNLWRLRMDRMRQMQAQATDFALRTNSQLSVAAYRAWKDRHASHKNAFACATQHYNIYLRYRFLMQWRISLRNRLRAYKKARQLSTTLAKRRAFEMWKEMCRQKKLERNLMLFQTLQKRRIMNYWRDQTRQQIVYRYAEERVVAMSQDRIVMRALRRWTERVIEGEAPRVRSWSTSRCFLDEVRAFRKWNALQQRHVEEFRLMESYQIIKQNEHVRKSFQRWLAATRAARYRRVTAERQEKEKRLKLLHWAWDKWRDQYLDEKLRPLEVEVLLQTQKNMLFRAYGIWYRQTKAIPILTLRNQNLKERVWAKWKSVIPRALQMRDAKEQYRQYLLRVFLRAWLQHYRTRLARRAIARARHLRLPASTKLRERATSDLAPQSFSKIRPSPGRWPIQRNSSPVREWRSSAVPSLRSISPARSMASAPAQATTFSRDRVDPNRDDETLAEDSTAGRSRLWRELQEVSDFGIVFAFIPAFISLLIKLFMMRRNIASLSNAQ